MHRATVLDVLDPNTEQTYLRYLVQLFDEVMRRYNTIKKTLNACDYEDLLVYFDSLLINDAILAELQEQFKYIMVDECQDTDPFQWTLIQKIAGDKAALASKKLFFVDLGIGKYELRLGNTSDNFPKLTDREALKTYFYIDIPQNGETQLSEFRNIYDWYGIRPTQLDAMADPMFYC